MTGGGSANAAVVARLGQCAARGERIGVALGVFGLIHAGTIAFLRQARARCDRLFVAVLPEPERVEGAERAAELLRPDERLRILALVEGVEAGGVALLAGGSPQEPRTWRQAAPEAIWMCAAAEEDVSATVRADLAQLGVELSALAGTETCTTRAVLERLAR